MVFYMQGSACFVVDRFACFFVCAAVVWICGGFCGGLEWNLEALSLSYVFAVVFLLF